MTGIAPASRTGTICATTKTESESQSQQPEAEAATIKDSTSAAGVLFELQKKQANRIDLLLRFEPHHHGALAWRQRFQVKTGPKRDISRQLIAIANRPESPRESLSSPPRTKLHWPLLERTSKPHVKSQTGASP